MNRRMLTALAASALCLTAFASAEAGSRNHHGGHGGGCETDRCGGHGGNHHGGNHHGGYQHGGHDHHRFDRRADRDKREDYLGPAHGLGVTIYGIPGGYAYSMGGYGDAYLAACARHRSFDPASGTFLAPDGRRHACRY